MIKFIGLMESVVWLGQILIVLRRELWRDR